MASLINPLSAVKMDALALATTLANSDIVGIIPGGPLIPGSIAAALLAEEILQC